MSTPLPVTLIGGYLGAGKTTLVNQLLRHADGLRIAVLVNEFGALPIDEDLIEATDDRLISIAGGCICCSFGSDLTAALIALSAFEPRPDHVLIEASGVALPGAIAGTIALLEQFRLDGVVVLADGMTLRAQLADEYIGDTIERQLADADLVVLTKADLITDAASAELERVVQARYRAKAVVRAAQGQVPKELLLGQFAPTAPRAGGLHRDGDYESIILEPGEGLDARALAQALATGNFGVLRAKGFVVDHSGQQMLIQVVGQRGEATPSDQAHAPAVVCIGLKGQLAQADLFALVAAPALS